MLTFQRLCGLTALALVLVLSLSLPVLAQEKVGICHATGSESNPYVFIEIAEPAVEAAHIDKDTGRLHGDHLGNVDFYAEEESECLVDGSTEPTPTPNQPTPTPTPTESPVPTPSPEVPVTGPTSTPGTTRVTVPGGLPDTSMLGS